MIGFRALASRIMALFHAGRLDRQLDDELRSHLEMLEEDHVRSGMSTEEARYAARRNFGGLEQTKESYRDTRGLPMLEALLQDLRYASRMFARHLALPRSRCCRWHWA